MSVLESTCCRMASFALTQVCCAKIVCPARTQKEQDPQIVRRLKHQSCFGPLLALKHGGP